jgi:serine/threonine protein kinase
MVSAAIQERFEIRRKLGSGSFGVVYAAFDRQRHRDVALKVLDRAGAETVARFKREFRYLAELRHPNLASMYELLVLGEQWILSMELVDGTDLLEHLAFAELQSALIGSRTFDPDERMVLRRLPRDARLTPTYMDHVRDTFRQLATAIAALHAHGVIHRDIKPSNIMITGQGRVVLLDFGLAAEIELDDSFDRRSVVGTPGYMSPEQIAAAAPTPASDWYSFGVMLYQALTGQPPFFAQSTMEIIERQMRGDFPQASSLVPGVPQDLALLAEALIARDPEARPEDAAVLHHLNIDFDPRRPERERARTGTLVGRGRELRRLRTLIEGTPPGQPRLIHLHGSPGTGKSALADRLLDTLRDEGGPMILGGRCHAWESVPMNAIDPIIDSLARTLRHEMPPRVAAILSRAAALSQVFPALAMVPMEAGDDTLAMPRGEKLLARAALELAAVLHAAAGERPLIIFLDDAQWGDYASAQFFGRLLRSEAPHRMVILFSFRSEDAPTSLLLQALKTFRAREIQIDGLSRGAVATLRGTRRGLDALWRQTKGNPALIEMMGDAPSLGAAVSARLGGLSAAGQRLFAYLLSGEGPVGEEEAHTTLELFEMDEPMRTLSRDRLVRVRCTGDLRELDLYHPHMRTVLRLA